MVCRWRIFAKRDNSNVLQLSWCFDIYRDNPTPHLRLIIFALLLFVRDIFVDRLIQINPVFVRKPMMLANYFDFQLYQMRILRRTHVPRLLAAFRIPQVIICPNRTVCMGGIFLCFYIGGQYLAFFQAQEFYGIEYSQISRIVKSVVVFLNSNWS